MKTVTSQEMAKLDRHAIEDLKIPSLTLMENAGFETAKLANAIAAGSKIAVVCGKGNNGGDGFVAARYLIEKFEKDVKIFLIGRKDEIKKDAKTNLERLKIDILEAGDSLFFQGAEPDLKNADLIIDAIFGIGLNAEVKTPYKEIITHINSLRRPVLSVDVPSGLDATDGKVLGAAIKAVKTIAFAAAKTGFYKNDGPDYCGEIVVVDIGIPIE